MDIDLSCASQSRYLVTGDREVTTTLLVSEKDELLGVSRRSEKWNSCV